MIVNECQLLGFVSVSLVHPLFYGCFHGASLVFSVFPWFILGVMGVSFVLTWFLGCFLGASFFLRVSPWCITIFYRGHCVSTNVVKCHHNGEWVPQNLVARVASKPRATPPHAQQYHPVGAGVVEVPWSLLAGAPPRGMG